jgi:hypothetical protein
MMWSDVFALMGWAAGAAGLFTLRMAIRRHRESRECELRERVWHLQSDVRELRQRVDELTKRQLESVTEGEVSRARAAARARERA